MTISAKVIADSVGFAGIRLTTLQLRYPRFIHAEFMTHRVFSRNASSSRAIPVERLIEDVVSDTAMPLHWGKNQPGMQAREEQTDYVELDVDGRIKEFTSQEAWMVARNNAIELAQAFDAAGYHKQIVNRLLEPFSHINVLVTATEFDNFFELRDHPDAQPEIAVLARQMKAAMASSEPTPLRHGDWHLPYVSLGDLYDLRHDAGYIEGLRRAKLVSTARCARVSYLTHDGKPTTLDADFSLASKLIIAKPIHASPAEHQATPANDEKFHKNFRGWIQFREEVERGLA